MSGLKLIITDTHNKIPANSQQQQKKSPCDICEWNLSSRKLFLGKMRAKFPALAMHFSYPCKAEELLDTSLGCESNESGSSVTDFYLIFY